MTCNQCGKTFRWTPILAGRTARCTCGNVIQCPKDPPQDATAYELASAPPPPVQRGVAPAPAASAPPKIALAYRAPKDESSAKSDPETIKNLYLPMWLLGGGVIIEIIAAFLTERHGIIAALMAVAAQLIVGTTFMLMGILWAVKFRGISLGPFWIAVFKLAAISVAPAALVAIFTPFLDHIPLGGLIGLVAEFVAYFALLGVLFDLDESDTWYCVCAIFIIHLAVYFSLLWATAKWG